MTSLTGKIDRGFTQPLRAGVGFTLVEVLLVCIIAGIILGLALPRVGSSLKYLKIKNACYDLSALIKYAQSRTVTEETYHRLNVDIANSRYWISRQSETNEYQYETLKTSLGRVCYLPEEISIDNLCFNDPDLISQEYIAFYPDGRADEATITLSNKDGDRFSICTTGRLGQVKVEEK